MKVPGKALTVLLCLFVLFFVAVSSNATGTSEDEGGPDKLVFKTYSGPQDGDEDYVNTLVGQILLEELNIEVEILQSTNESTQLSIDMASDSLPDIFNFFVSPVNLAGLSTLEKAIDEGLIADVSGIVANSPVLSKMVTKERMPMFTRTLMYNEKYDGKLYMLCGTYAVTSPWVSGWGLYIRKDVAEALNLETPADVKTIEEFRALIEEIDAGGFVDVNGNEIYALGLMQPWWQPMAAITRPYDFGGNVRFDIDPATGKIAGFIESQYARDQVLWIRNLVADGLMDPETFTQAYEIGTEKMAQARYGICTLFGSWGRNKTPWGLALTEEHPEMAYIPLGNMNTYKGDDTYTINKGMEALPSFMINAKADLDVVARYLEWINDETGENRVKCIFGAKAESADAPMEEGQWFWNADGFVQMTDAAFAERSKSAKEYNLKYGTRVLTMGWLGGKNDPNYAVYGPNGVGATYQNSPDATVETAANVEATMPADKLEVVNKVNLDYLMQLYPDKDRLEPVLNQVKDLENSILYQSYLAKSDEDALEILAEFVETLYDSGYQDYLDYLDEEYNKDPERYATYVTDVQ